LTKGEEARDVTVGVVAIEDAVTVVTVEEELMG
jgi:hypothetical protein